VCAVDTIQGSPSNGMGKKSAKFRAVHRASGAGPYIELGKPQGEHNCNCSQSNKNYMHIRWVSAIGNKSPRHPSNTTQSWTSKSTGLPEQASQICVRLRGIVALVAVVIMLTC